MRGFFCALFAGIICLESLCGLQFREDIIKKHEPTSGILYETGEADLPQELMLYAQGAVLLDADSGRVLYGKNETTPMAMASTTKIMTCILVLENAKVDEIVSVSAYAATMPKVKLYVKCQEHYTVRELLFSLMLESHNDAAVVLGEYIGAKLLGEMGEISEHTGEESKAALHRFAQAMNEKAEIRVMEPYVHGQFTESSASPYEGRSHVHWLTGTASTVMVGCVEGICGMRTNAEGICINPSIPSGWDGFKITKNFRGKKLVINFDNSAHVESGVKEVVLNGEKLADNFISADKLADTNEINVILG